MPNGDKKCLIATSVYKVNEVVLNAGGKYRESIVANHRKLSGTRPHWSVV